MLQGSGDEAPPGGRAHTKKRHVGDKSRGICFGRNFAWDWVQQLEYLVRDTQMCFKTDDADALRKDTSVIYNWRMVI